LRIKNFIQPLFGTDKMILRDFDFNPVTQIITASVRLHKKETNKCGICNKKGKRYDSGRGLRRWRALDLGEYRLYVEAEVHRVICKEHGVITCSVPWARHGSGFCRNFEDTAAWLACEASQSMVSRFLRVDWHSVGNICRRVYEDLEAKLETSRFDGLVNIGIDETSYKKGHKYLTVVVDHDTNSVVWCHKGFGKGILSKFFDQLSPEQRASIECVTADGAKWIAESIKEYCPNATRCVDPFHVVGWTTEVLDDLRKQSWREAQKILDEQPKRKPGRPKKDEVKSPEVIEAEKTKKLKYAVLKNPENLTDNQQGQLEFIAKSNPRLYRGYLLKEKLRLVLKEGPETIEQELKSWMGWAQRCRIPEFRDLRDKIKRHYDAIIATANYGLSNARIEATNNKIKLIIRRAYGFRNIDNLLALIMLSCSNTKPTLPGR
jgi:transposase